MTGQDEYSVEVVKHEYTGATKTMSESTRFETEAESDLYAILSRLTRELGNFPDFYYGTQQTVLLPNVRDGRDREVYAKVDAKVFGNVYGEGIIRVQGGIHRTRKHQLRDPVQKERLEKMGYWVEDLSNSEASHYSQVVQRLEPHRRPKLEKGAFP